MKFMIAKFPERAFDVGIAEQHAVTLSAGLATQGMIPFCAIYSTFLQRAYDQIIHDVALQNLPVIFCIDRAGLVGEDGATHHGVFDMVYLRCIPNMVIFAPMDEIELRNMMYTAQLKLENPIAIRYPRGRGSNLIWQKEFETIEMGKGRIISEGKDLAILTIGPIGEKVRSLTRKRTDLSIAHFDMRFVKPLDKHLLDHILSNYNKIITIEDGVVLGGFGSAVLEYANSRKNTQAKIECLGLPDTFIEHGSVEQLYESVGLDEKGIQSAINRLLKE
jgi:1-deoxy-D-xylulose-5-phosphate synthase